jgi:hypothetical protein
VFDGASVVYTAATAVSNYSGYSCVWAVGRWKNFIQDLRKLTGPGLSTEMFEKEETDLVLIIEANEMHYLSTAF